MYPTLIYCFKIHVYWLLLTSLNYDAKPKEARVFNWGKHWKTEGQVYWNQTLNVLTLAEDIKNDTSDLSKMNPSNKTLLTKLNDLLLNIHFPMLIMTEP